jgi:Fe-Mn family superoxide dismutase
VLLSHKTPKENKLECKQFEKANPEKEELMYESFNKKIKLLNEQILLTEKEEIKNNLLLEMKKIGIEKLPYAYSALKKFVGTETMDIHYNKHYKGYVKKLNDALSKTNKKYEDLEDIIKSISKFDTKVRNNAGGAFNHALFWKMLSPKKQIPKGEVFEMITKQYGNIKKMKDEFNEIAKERFGSGWVWLVLTKTNRLKIMSTPNQDNPLMNIVKDGGYPLLGLDLWEHAYYLRYRNKRDEYIKKFWNYVNWEFVNELYTSKTKKTLNEANGRFAGLWSNARRINISDDDIDHPDNEPIDDFYKKYPQGSWYNEEGRRAIRAKLSNPDLPILRKLCPSGGYGNNPFCRLNHMSRFLDNDTRVDLEVAMEILSDYFRIKTVGLFPKIVQLALDNDGRTVNYLKLLADFIDDDKFDDTETKKILNKQRNSEKIPSNLEDLLKQAREITKDLKANDIEISEKKEIIAMIAYLQRMGTDINK